MTKVLTFSGWLLALAAGLAQATSADIQRCRPVTEASARLACYDAIALTVSHPSPSPSSTPASAPPHSSTAQADREANSQAASASTRFGLPAVRHESEANDLHSRIVGRVESFSRGHEYRLENGQVWRITETAIGFYQLDNPRVKITKGFLSNFYMQIDGVAAAPKVRRVK
jgi:hypothetical protein